jgi:hypothetical protein
MVTTLIGGASIAIAFDGGAPTAKTGAPAIGAKTAEGTCADCHNDFALNTGGSVTLAGAPTYYVPGTVYTFNVTVASTMTAGAGVNRLWGFELTAVNMSDGTGAGTFAPVAGQGTVVATGTGQFSTRGYVRVSTNDQAGVASPVSWQVQWTAPNPGVGSVSFYASGLAADGANGNSGDYVYTGSASAKDVTPTDRTSWGGIKARYR